MLTLKQIIKSSRMMHQYAGEYNGFYSDHISENNIYNNDLDKNPIQERVEVKLGYEVGKDGDLRIVQK